MIITALELSKMLGVTVNTVYKNKDILGFVGKNKYDTDVAVPRWISRCLELQKNKLDPGREKKEIELLQEKEKLLKLQREREILEARFIPVEDSREMYSKIVHNTKSKFLALCTTFPNKLYKKKKSEIKRIVKQDIYKALEELSKGV